MCHTHMRAASVRLVSRGGIQERSVGVTGICRRSHSGVQGHGGRIEVPRSSEHFIIDSLFCL